MVNTVARHYGGHPFEDKYACLTDLQIAVLYRQAFLDKKEEHEEKYEGVVIPLFKAWSEKVNDITESLSMFSNPELYKKYRELKDNEEYVQEVEEDNQEQILFDTLKQIDNVITVIAQKDGEQEEDKEKDDEFSEMLTGWIGNTKDVLNRLKE